MVFALVHPKLGVSDGIWYIIAGVLSFWAPHLTVLCFIRQMGLGFLVLLHVSDKYSYRHCLLRLKIACYSSQYKFQFLMDTDTCTAVR